MAGKPNPNKTKELKIYPSVQVIVRLNKLAKLGFKGTTAQTVALALIGDRIEELLKDGILKLDDVEEA